MIERITDKQKPCTYCAQYGHTAFKCGRKAQDKAKAGTYKGMKISSSFGGQRKPMKRATKPMNKTGRVTKETNAATARWKKTQPANHEGYWTCHYCLKWTKEPVVEHMESKTRRQDLRTVESNFTIACSDCNGKKLSKSHDEFCQRCP